MEQFDEYRCHPLLLCTSGAVGSNVPFNATISTLHQNQQCECSKRHEVMRGQLSLGDRYSKAFLRSATRTADLPSASPVMCVYSLLIHKHSATPS